MQRGSVSPPRNGLQRKGAYVIATVSKNQQPLWQAVISFLHNYALALEYFTTTTVSPWYYSRLRFITVYSCGILVYVIVVDDGVRAVHMLNKVWLDTKQVVDTAICHNFDC